MESDTTGHWAWEWSVTNGSFTIHLQNKTPSSIMPVSLYQNIHSRSTWGKKNELLSQSPSACSSYAHSSLASPALLPCVYVKPKLTLT